MKTRTNSAFRYCIIALVYSMLVPLSFGDYWEDYVNANAELYQVDSDVKNAHIFMYSGRLDTELYPRQKHLVNKELRWTSKMNPKVKAFVHRRVTLYTNKDDIIDFLWYLSKYRRSDTNEIHSDIAKWLKKNKDISKLKIGFYDSASKKLHLNLTLEEYCEMCTKKQG